MYYVCKKRNDGTFGIMDTTDGIVEYYSPRAIGKMITQFHLQIEGARVIDGRLKLTVKKPTKFEDRGTYDENGMEITNSQSESPSSLVRCGFASEFRGLYENTLRSEFIDKLQESAGFMIRALNKIVGGISGVIFDDLTDLDGWDCVGFEDIHVKGHPEFTVSIYTNPEVSVVELGNGNWELKSVNSSGFGIDLYIGRDIISHINGSWKTWEKDIKESEGYKLIYGKDTKSITPLDEMNITEYDNLVYPLFKLICDIANTLPSHNFNISDVQYLDGYDCVGLEFTSLCKFGLPVISVQSNGLANYNKTGVVNKDITVNFNFDNHDIEDLSFSDFEDKIPQFEKYIKRTSNRIEVLIPENDYTGGITTLDNVKSLIGLQSNDDIDNMSRLVDLGAKILGQSYTLNNVSLLDNDGLYYGIYESGLNSNKGNVEFWLFTTSEKGINKFGHNYGGIWLQFESELPDLFSTGELGTLLELLEKDNLDYVDIYPDGTGVYKELDSLVFTEFGGIFIKILNDKGISVAIDVLKKLGIIKN